MHSSSASGVHGLRYTNKNCLESVGHVLIGPGALRLIHFDSHTIDVDCFRHVFPNDSIATAESPLEFGLGELLVGMRLEERAEIEPCGGSGVGLEILALQRTSARHGSTLRLLMNLR